MSFNLTGLEQEVQAMGEDPTEWRGLCSRIREHSPLLIQAAKPVQPGAEQASRLLAFIHSINRPSYGPIPALLLAVQSRQPEPPLLFVSEVGTLLRSLRPEQVQASPRDFVTLCRRATTTACDTGIANMLVRPLLHAIDVLAEDTHSLTALHVLFLQAAISAKTYSFAAKFIRERPVFGLASKDETLESSDYLRYFYYAGIVAISQKDYTDALDCFTKTMIAPATAVSAVVIESYKKAMLVSLIKDGQRFELPRLAAPPVQRYCHRHEALYEQLAQAFKARNLSGLVELVLVNEGNLQQDGNLGLAKQVIAALTKHRIRELTSTYMTLSLSDIGSSAGGISAGDAEQALLEMIKANSIAATIDDATQMVRFLDEQEALAGASVFQQLEAAMATAMTLNEHIREVEAKLYTNPTFISKLVSGGSRAIAHDRLGIDDLDYLDSRNVSDF